MIVFHQEEIQLTNHNNQAHMVLPLTNNTNKFKDNNTLNNKLNNQLMADNKPLVKLFLPVDNNNKSINKQLNLAMFNKLIMDNKVFNMSSNNKPLNNNNNHNTNMSIHHKFNNNHKPQPNMLFNKVQKDMLNHNQPKQPNTFTKLFLNNNNKQYNMFNNNHKLNMFMLNNQQLPHQLEQSNTFNNNHHQDNKPLLNK